MNTREHEARYDPSMTGRLKCYYCPRCGRYVTNDAEHPIRVPVADFVRKVLKEDFGVSDDAPAAS